MLQTHNYTPHVVNVENTMSAIDVANLLDQMEYSTTGTNWKTLAKMVVGANGKVYTGIFKDFQ